MEERTTMHDTVTTAHIEENVVAGKRMGRHYRWDSRSARFLTPRTAVTSVLWQRKGPIFDQGNLGSCTGNAAWGALGTEPIFSSLPASTQLRLNEAQAVKLYSEATVLD